MKIKKVLYILMFGLLYISVNNNLFGMKSEKTAKKDPDQFKIIKEIWVSRLLLNKKGIRKILARDVSRDGKYIAVQVLLNNVFQDSVVIISIKNEPKVIRKYNLVSIIGASFSRNSQYIALGADALGAENCSFEKTGYYTFQIRDIKSDDHISFIVDPPVDRVFCPFQIRDIKSDDHIPVTGDPQVDSPLCPLLSCWDYNSQYFLIFYGDMLVICDMETKRVYKKKLTLLSHKNIAEMAFVEKSTVVVFCSKDGAVWVYDVTSEKDPIIHKEEDPHCSCKQLTPCGRYVLYGSDEKIQIFDIIAKKYVFNKQAGSNSWETPWNNITNMAFCKKGNKVIIDMHGLKKIKIFDRESENEICEYSLDNVIALHPSKRGRFITANILSSWLRSKIMVFDNDKQKSLCDIPPMYRPIRFAYSKNYDRLILLGFHSKLTIFQTSDEFRKSQNSLKKRDLIVKDEKERMSFLLNNPQCFRMILLGNNKQEIKNPFSYLLLPI